MVLGHALHLRSRHGFLTLFKMPQDQDSFSLFENILTTGSSLNPTFLLIVDGTFLLLFVVFIGLAVATRGNIHILALMAIELGLWGSIKWYVCVLL